MAIEKDTNEYTKSFWKYASQIKGVADIENVFIDWAATNNQNLTLDNIQDIWKNINQDIFDIRTAFNADAFKMILDDVLKGQATPEEEKIVEEVNKDQGSAIPAGMAALGNELKPAATENSNSSSLKSENKNTIPPEQPPATPKQEATAPSSDSPEMGKSEDKILAEALLL